MFEFVVTFFEVRLNFICHLDYSVCTGGRTRTYNQWFWRPLLCQLSYTRKLKAGSIPVPSIRGREI